MLIFFFFNIHVLYLIDHFVHFFVKEYRYGTITILSPMTQLGFEKKQLYFLDASSTLQKNVQNDLLNTKRECWKKKKLTCILYILGILQFTILQKKYSCFFSNPNWVIGDRIVIVPYLYSFISTKCTYMYLPVMSTFVFFNSVCSMRWWGCLLCTRPTRLVAIFIVLAH
jgi:hypothetical protein